MHNRAFVLAVLLLLVIGAAWHFNGKGIVQSQHHSHFNSLETASTLEYIGEHSLVKGGYARLVGERFFDTIVARSKRQAVTILKFRVVKNQVGVIYAMPVSHVRFFGRERILFVDAVDPSGVAYDIRWHVEAYDRHPTVGIMVIDRTQLRIGMVVRIGIFQEFSNADDYFVGVRHGVETKDGVGDFGGCAKIANGVAYNVDYNEGVHIVPMTDLGGNYHGWCYSYRKFETGSAHAQLHRHYFAMSTAKSWVKVAEYSKKEFLAVESRPSSELPRIARELQLRSKSVSKEVKIASIRQWMGRHLRYNSERNFAFRALPFDKVVERGNADCKDSRS